MAAVESAQWLDLASQPPKGFNVLHPFRIRPLNDHKDKKNKLILLYFFVNIILDDVAALMDADCERGVVACIR
jgi:hypothetical protein